jgi:hypothetical protein
MMFLRKSKKMVRLDFLSIGSLEKTFLFCSKYLEKHFEIHHRNNYSMMFLRESKIMMRLNFLSIGSLEKTFYSVQNI